MTDRFFAGELIGREVLTSGGRRIGILADLVIDCDDGTIAHLLVDPDGSVMSTVRRVDGLGRIVVSAERMRTESGRIVINLDP